jgi:hypothetical protein
VTIVRNTEYLHCDTLSDLFVCCFTAHQHLGHIGPTICGDNKYIRRGIAIIRHLRQAGLGRGSILPIRCHSEDELKDRFHWEDAIVASHENETVTLNAELAAAAKPANFSIKPDSDVQHCSGFDYNGYESRMSPRCRL